MCVGFRHSFDDNDNDDHDDADDNEAPSESSSHAGMGVEQLSANGGGGGMGEALRPIFVTYYVPGAVFCWLTFVDHGPHGRTLCDIINNASSSLLWPPGSPPPCAVKLSRAHCAVPFVNRNRSMINRLCSNNSD